MRSLVKRFSRMLMAAPRGSGSPRTAQIAGVAMLVELVLHDDACCGSRRRSARRRGCSRSDCARSAPGWHSLRRRRRHRSASIVVDCSRKCCGAQQDARCLAIANAQAFDRRVGAGDVEDRAAGQCGSHRSRRPARRPTRRMPRAFTSGGRAVASVIFGTRTEMVASPVGRRGNEQCLAQRAGAAVAAVGHVHRGAVGGLRPASPGAIRTSSPSATNTPSSAKTPMEMTERRLIVM